MHPYPLRHLLDRDLLADLYAMLRQDCGTTARLLAYLGEVERRKLYLPAGYSSMFWFCVRELHMSEDCAFKRLRAARAARRHPAIFSLVAEGRLHLSAVVLLAPHLRKLRPEIVEELVAVATHKSKREIEQLLAERFPQADVPTIVRPIQTAAAAAPLAPQHDDANVVPPSEERRVTEMGLVAPGPVVPCPEPEFADAKEPLAASSAIPFVGSSGSRGAPPWPRLSPLSPGRYALQVTLDQATYDLLREAQDLLGHVLPSGDVATVLERALRELVERLRKQKFAETSAPRPGRGSANGRYIPAAVKREVRQRDGGQCTFVSSAGKRCEARSRLEFDHAVPFACGGQTTAANLRLRCRPHNQHAAEQAYGAEFMREKIERARHAEAPRAPAQV